MSRLADYFAIVGYDHANDRKEPREGLEGEVGVEGWAAAGDWVGRGGKGGSCHLDLHLRSALTPTRLHPPPQEDTWAGSAFRRGPDITPVLT